MRPCGKNCYDKKGATSAANQIFKRGPRRRNKPKALRIYHCEKCNAWHITSKPLEPNE